MTGETQIVRRLTFAYVTALCLIGILSGLMHWMLAAVIDSQSDAAVAINIAGRQRMLSQRIVYLAGDALRDDPASASSDLRAAIDQMDRANSALINGDASFGIAANLAKRQGMTNYSAAATKLNEDFGKFIEAARLVADDQAARPQREAAYSYLHDAAVGPFLDELNDATAEIVANSGRRVANLRDVQNISLIVLLTTLILEALFIFRPLIQRLRSYLVRLYSVATTDALTGLSNRRHFFDVAEASARMIARKALPAAVIMVDIDHFKSINDRLGHDAGDRTLIWFANAFQDIARESDVIGRLGGEEFASFLPDTTMDQAYAAAERLRRAIEERARPDGIPPFTVSIGAAPLLENEVSLGPALKAADIALYEAKSYGRNRIVRAARTPEASVAALTQPEGSIA